MSSIFVEPTPSSQLKSIPLWGDFHDQLMEKGKSWVGSQVSQLHMLVALKDNAEKKIFN